MQGTKTAQKRKETLLLRKKRVGFHYKGTCEFGFRRWLGVQSGKPGMLHAC